MNHSFDILTALYGVASYLLGIFFTRRIYKAKLRDLATKADAHKAEAEQASAALSWARFWSKYWRDNYTRLVEKYLASKHQADYAEKGWEEARRWKALYNKLLDFGYYEKS